MPKRRSNGEGSVFKEDSTGYWVAELSLPDGKRKRKRAKAQKVVREWLIEQRKALQDGLLLPDEKMTLGAFLDRYMEDVAAHTLKPASLHSYKYLVDSHVKPELGRLKLTALRPDHLQTLYSQKIEQGLSKRTVQYIHAVIRRALNQAVKWGLLYRNPTDAVTAPGRRRKNPTPSRPNKPNASLIPLRIPAGRPSSWKTIYMLAVLLGLRKGEILGLRWEDVNWGHGTISINNTSYEVGGRNYQGSPKSAQSRRTMAMPSMVKEVLQGYQQVTGRSEGLVFTTMTGKPLSNRNVTRQFHADLEKAGLSRIRFHDLRHTAATLLLQAKAHPKFVQEMLGHSSISLTMDTYSHIIPGMKAEAAEKMDNIFGQV